MTEIAIYVEGGGDTAQQRAELRNGLDRLLDVPKQAAREKRLRWKVIPSGGRDATYDAFMNAIQHANDDTLCVLLVDSEEALAAETKGRPHVNAHVRKRHLEIRDGWDLKDIEADPLDGPVHGSVAPC
jgi:hypothetical protein